MITDAEIKQLTDDVLNKHVQNIKPGEIPTESFRGVTMYMWENQHPGACNRHMIVFNNYNVIPEYCFNCFKVTIKPRNVIEHIKLMMVFDRIELPHDNTRKCIVECRENIPGTYLGLVYCVGIEEAEAVSELIKKVVTDEISGEIPVGIKRGCTPFDIAYPGYARVEQGKTFMDYPDEWREYEESIDSQLSINEDFVVPQTHNVEDYTERDAQVIAAWLMYAARIGDRTYLDLTGGVALPPLHTIDTTGTIID